MKRKQRLVDRGSIPKEDYPFPLMPKGERKNRCMETKRNNRCIETGGAMVTGGEMITGGA
jgi:hypothetical protein